MSVEGRTIILIVLALEQLNHSTIWEKIKYSVKDTNKQQRRQKYWNAHLGACYLQLEYLDEYSINEVS
jgi:hypothetical protein